MKLGIMQPYFFPYIGYFQLVNYVDTYIIYDDVNYIKNGWINRNYILLNGKKHLITLPLNKSTPNKLIKDIDIGNKKAKVLKTIQQAYSKSSNFNEAFPIIEKILLFENNNLAIFLMNLIRSIAEYLDIKTKFLLSSDIQKNNECKGEDKILHICDLLKADEYINAIGGMALYSKTRFQERNIKLSFLKTNNIKYHQGNKVFIPNLSMIDVLMNNSKSKITNHLNSYEIV